MDLTSANVSSNGVVLWVIESEETNTDKDRCFGGLEKFNRKTWKD